MYVNTYVLGVPEEKKDDYVRIANLFAEIAKDFGALEIFESWELEVPDGKHTDYRRAVKAEPGEKIVLSWVVWPDRETGAKAHKGMFADPRKAKPLKYFEKGRIKQGYAMFEDLESSKRSRWKKYFLKAIEQVS